MARRRHSLWCAFAIAAGATAARADTDIVADPRLRLEAARYAPTDPELVWTGWIGGSVALVRIDRTAFDFTYEMETVLGDVVRPFEATQANYHLEGAVRHRFGAIEAGPFFHHVSRHAIDRLRPVSVDWNVVGLRLAGTAGHGASFMVSAGRMLRSSPGYEWEFEAHAAADLLPDSDPTAEVRTDVRWMIASPSGPIPALARGDFVDWRVEAGPAWRRGARRLTLFAAFERRNDVFLLEPGARSRLLLGFRILLDRDRP